MLFNYHPFQFSWEPVKGFTNGHLWPKVGLGSIQKMLEMELISDSTHFLGERPQHGDSYNAMVESSYNLVFNGMYPLLCEFLIHSFDLPLPWWMWMNIIYCAGTTARAPILSADRTGWQHPVPKLLKSQRDWFAWLRQSKFKFMN